MKPPLLYLVLGSLLFGADEPAPRPQPQICLPAKILSVTDGDTVQVEVSMRMSVRLIGAWAPETNKKAERKAGLASKAKLEEMVAGKTGLLTVPLGDNLGRSISLGRVLGKLSVDGVDVSEAMVKEGFATKNKEK